MTKRPSSLELFLLAAVGHGISSSYDLLTRFRFSVGATHPALNRLLEGGLIKEARPGAGARPEKLAFQITEKGRKVLMADARQLLGEKPPQELEPVLRIACLALVTGSPTAAAEYLRTVANERLERAARRAKDAVEASHPSRTVDFYPWMKAICDRYQLEAESRGLRKVASEVARSRRKSRSSR